MPDSEMTAADIIAHFEDLKAEARVTMKRSRDAIDGGMVPEGRAAQTERAVAARNTLAERDIAFYDRAIAFLRRP